MHKNSATHPQRYWSQRPWWLRRRRRARCVCCVAMVVDIETAASLTASPVALIQRHHFLCRCPALGAHIHGRGRRRSLAASSLAAG
jgi:hypothetical protein